MRVDAKTFEVVADLDGALVTIRIRAYIRFRRVLAIRSAHVLSGRRKRLPMVRDGWFSTIAALKRARQ